MSYRGTFVALAAAKGRPRCCPDGARAPCALVRPSFFGLILLAMVVGLARPAAAGAAPAKHDARAGAVATPPDSSVPFVAVLRPAAGVVDSIAYGRAIVRVNPADGSARISLSSSNLAAPVSAAFVEIRTAEGGAPQRAWLPKSAVVEHAWRAGDREATWITALPEAAARELASITVATTEHPQGELRGDLLPASAANEFTPPAAPKWTLPPRPDAVDAARFLMQATFGPTQQEIERLETIGYEAWLDQQSALPPTSHLAGTRADFEVFRPDAGNPVVSWVNRQAAWWKIAATAPDQLRQRVAFALSEIFVVSQDDAVLYGQPEALADYYDLLTRSAFGNFRQLLEDVSLSPVMGTYLSHARNAKANPERKTSPDENYAREVMQLFTIGLNELHPDGTMKLDARARPVPTYDQATVGEMARVFTGWGYFSTRPSPDFAKSAPNYFQPMMLFPAEHDSGPKTIIGGRKLPAEQGGGRDLADTLDALFHHPNTAPFICRQLIQRLVTSNPSPGYVHRIAAVFARNRAGVRGDLGAVVRAILTDHEARSPQVASHPGYGKLKEPVLRVTGLLRALDGSSPTDRFHLPNATVQLGQAPLAAPTVFNFFLPDYVEPGPLESAGLAAPEFQVMNAVTAIGTANQLTSFIYAPDNPGNNTLALPLDAPFPIAESPETVLDQLDLLLCAGRLAPATRVHITEALSSLPDTATTRDRLRLAVELIALSPAAAVQR